MRNFHDLEFRSLNTAKQTKFAGFRIHVCKISRLCFNFQKNFWFKVSMIQYSILML